MVDISSPFLNLQKGTSVLLNVLNRADTNGDGVLAKEEFLNFFWDAILTEDELCELFDEINIHRTGFIDAGELSAFVWQHMGKFPGLLAALEDLSVAVRKGLQQMEKTYDASSIQEQFVSRFLVRETVFQLSKLTAALDASQKRLQEEGIPLIDGSDSSDDDGEALRSPTTSCNFQAAVGPKSLQVYKPCPSRLLPVRLRKQVVTQTSLHLEESSHDLNAQIKKLAAIVEKLANQPKFQKPQEDELDITEESLLFLVQQTMPVEEGQLDNYKESLKTYAEKTAACAGCLFTSVRFYKDIITYAVYEVWESEDTWNKHLRSHIYKTLQHQNIECLRKPEFLNTMEIPGKYRNHSMKEQ
ncbi:N-terminal EF-hand calcium-binding protein 1 isoform X1 [Dermacentor silvarum]|uniref:N-terminal EF-hand calcium-binding protein 1 isoform X1 n=1 Tax=Dermacentor silvarum TaxID=543639 RepID=UPI0021011B98|nr:N-terminal EF-hand calcium-binding protein 1 isoform X1 [Dermacentor silvarum]